MKQDHIGKLTPSSQSPPSHLARALGEMRSVCVRVLCCVSREKPVVEMYCTGVVRLREGWGRCSGHLCVERKKSHLRSLGYDGSTDKNW
jgi:hypothetical protein